MRIKRDKTYNQFVPGIEPYARISSGDTLTVETFDALFKSAEARGYIRNYANPAAGPIYVNGAEPGDTIEVEIHDIKLIGNGFLYIPKKRTPASNTDDNYKCVEVEALSDGNLRVLYNNKIFPAQPMIGVIGVASDSNTCTSSVETGDHGGNMDNNAIIAGVKVYLPVFVEGALLGIGDIHGVMGDGEVFGQGVEICADVDITVTVKKDMKVNRPLVISDETVSATASADTMEKASETAISDMRFILETHYGLTPVDAALAIAFYGNLRVCQIVNRQKSMRMEVRKDMIELFKK